MNQLLPESLKRSISRLREDIHSVLDRWTRRRNGASNASNWQISTASFNPVVELDDKGDEVVVVAELPGFDEKDVHIDIMDNRLVMRGSKKMEHEERGDNFYRVAKGVTEFTRMLPLPPGIDVQRANAKLKNGVLRVVLPKSEHAKARRVQIRAS